MSVNVLAFANPKEVGRGCWYNLLVITAAAPSDDDTKYIICKQIRNIAYTYFKCLECRKHSGEYLISHPPDDVINDDNGLFNYIVDFMNDVNRRLGKDEHKKEILYQLISQPSSKIHTGTYEFSEFEKMKTGFWYSLLVIAATMELNHKMLVCKQIRLILYTMNPCKEIKDLARSHLINNPPESFTGTIFEYLLNIMNPPDREMIYRIFHEPEYIRCIKGCNK